MPKRSELIMLKNSLIVTVSLVCIVSIISNDCVAVEFGISGGYRHSYFGGDDGDKFGSRNTFSGGLHSSVSLLKNFGFELGVQYVQSGADGESVVFADFDNGIRMIPVEANQNIDYVTFPLKLRVDSPVRAFSLIPSLALGLVPVIKLSATTKFSPTDSFTRNVFKFSDIPITQDIQNIRSTDLWLLVSPALDIPMSGRRFRIQAEWTFGLTTPFGELECDKSGTDPRVLCDRINGLFNYGMFETTPAMLKNRSFMVTVSLIL